MKKIMVVEDDPKNLDMVTRFLTRSKFEVLVPNNAEEAVTLAREMKPDVILMDLTLSGWTPPADGLELTRRIREILPLGTVPIIAFTAHSFEHGGEKAQEAGCNEFIQKPVDYFKLMTRLKEITLSEVD